MATETGVVQSIESDRSSAEIIKDTDGTLIQTIDVSTTLVVDDGVSFEEDGGKAIKLKEITKVDIKGDLTREEEGILASLIKTVNLRNGGDGGGGGAVSIHIKTKK